MIPRLLKFFNQPYPEPLRSGKSWLLIFGISFIVFLILYLFQPFGLYTLESSQKVFFISGYGLITGLTLVLYLQVLPLLFKNIFSDKNWKVWKHILWLLAIVLTIGIGNVLYTSFYIKHITLNWPYILIFEGFTLAVATIPIVLTVSFSYIKHLRRNLLLATAISYSPPTISDRDDDEVKPLVITGQNKNERIELYANQFMYAKAEGNYVQICYYQNDSLQQDLLRLTLNNLLSYFDDFDFIVKCHRAFIVNINKVVSAEGNAQGLKLKLNDISDVVSVSRNFVQKIKSIT